MKTGKETIVQFVADRATSADVGNGSLFWSLFASVSVMSIAGCPGAEGLTTLSLSSESDPGAILGRSSERGDRGMRMTTL